MAYIHVDIDLDEFDTDDLIEEVMQRFKPNKLTQKDKEEFNRLKSKLNNVEILDAPKNNSATDVWKDELWPKIKAKFTFWQLEELL